MLEVLKKSHKIMHFCSNRSDRQNAVKYKNACREISAAAFILAIMLYILKSIHTRMQQKN